MEHFGVERSSAQIQHAIAAQTFQAAKKRYLEQGDDKRATFLRAGRAGAWPSELSDAQQQFCRERFGNMLAQLDYKVADAPAE